MDGTGTVERIETVVVGGGQAGLSVGYHLARRGLPFVILDAHERIGDSWRCRWDSLHLFTPARYDSLTGLAFPAPAHSFPSKDEMGDYLEAYAKRFELPVRTGVTVDGVARSPRGGFLVSAGASGFEAENVVIAMATHQRPRFPQFAGELAPDIVQMHAGAYRGPAQLRDGAVLVVGAGNSGAEIALDVAASHQTWLAGRDTGHVPFRIDAAAARVLVPIVLRLVFHRLLTLDTPLGRRVRPGLLAHGHTLVRVKPRDLTTAGIARVPRVVGTRNGRPELEDGRVLDVANVVWCTGFAPDFTWIKLPVFDETEPVTRRGVVVNEPGLYFVGQLFLYAASSAMIHGVGRDAEHVVDVIAARRRSQWP
jgi:putative flavoprotein involved in K+ transport